MSLYSMTHGVLRIYESTDTVRGAAAASCWVASSGGTSYADKSTEAKTDDTGYTGTFCVAASDAIYVGSTSKFCRVQFLKGGGAYATVSGALVAEYYNGASWVALTATDRTASGGNCFVQDGVVSFSVPSDWALNGGGGGMSATQYYVRFKTTLVPGIPPSADILWPVDGMFYTVKFSDGNLSAPEGRAKVEEAFVLDRGRGSVGVHAIAGVDDAIINPLDLSFSIRVASTFNKDDIREALTCGTPAYDANWSGAGASTKTDSTFVDGSGSTVNFPAFEDTNKKTVCVQILWTRGGVAYGREFNEVFFPLDQQSLAESADGVVLSCTGKIYGAIRAIYAFGYKW